MTVLNKSVFSAISIYSYKIIFLNATHYSFLSRARLIRYTPRMFSTKHGQIASVKPGDFH